MLASQFVFLEMGRKWLSGSVLQKIFNIKKNNSLLWSGMKQKLCKYFNGRKKEHRIKCWDFPGCHDNQSTQSEDFVIFQCVTFSLVIDPNTSFSGVAIPDIESLSLLTMWFIAFYGLLEVAPIPQELHQ